MSKIWYIDTSGKVEGPLTLSELRSRAADGRLRSSDGVSTDQVQWIPARQVAELVFPPTTILYTDPTRPPPKQLTETVVSGYASTGGSEPVDAAKFSPLDSVPGYQVIAPLGTGACGVVFKAVQVNLNRVVALKTVRMAENMPADIVTRFEQEAVALARLKHPNIVAVYDCGHTHGRAFFAMELLEGEDLSKLVERTGPLDERTAWLVARQTAAALAHAAKLGVIHRDVKPANLFLVEPPTGFPLPPGVPMVKVTDFGLALARRNPNDSDHHQTAAGVVLGTPVYMAPEQFTGSNVDPRADIYSLGATMYHILTGKSPFDGRTVWEVMMKKAMPCPRLEPPVSKESADLVESMVAVDVAVRPPDYTELIARIDALPCLGGAFSAAGLPVILPTQPPSFVRTTSPAPEPARRRKGWVYAVAAVAVLGVAVGIAAVAGAFNWSQEKTEPDTKQPSKPVTYKAGPPESLYDGRSVIPWATQGWVIDKDDEKKPVLAGQGVGTRRFREVPNFRLTVGIDLHKATKADVIIATADGPAPAATRWIVRLDRNAGVSFGKCVGSGAFEATGTVAFPPPKKDQPPYLELKYERSGGTLAAWFDNQPLGRTSDDGLKTTELRIDAIDGPIRIESADLVELLEQR